MAAPALRVPVCVVGRAEKQPALLQVVRDLARDVARFLALEPAVPGDEACHLIDGHEDGKLLGLGEREVLGAAAGGDVDETGPLGGAHVLPRDDAVSDDARARSGQLVERPSIAHAEQRAPLEGFEDLRVRPLRLLERLLRNDEHLVTDLGAHVVELGVDGEGDIRGKGPRGRRPDQERLALLPVDRESDIHGQVRHLAIAVAHRHLVLRQSGAAARAPGHRSMTLVEPALLVHELQHVPDVRDVQIAVRVVRVRPVHPLTHPDRVLGDGHGGSVHALAASLGEFRDPVRLDIPLAVEVQLALDLHLDPEALAVEAVLIALVVAEHRLVPLVEVLVGPRPHAVDAHGLDVRGDRTVDEGEAGAAGILLPERGEALLALPEVEHAMLELGQVELRPDRPESSPLRCLFARLRHVASNKTKRRPERSGRRKPRYHPSWREPRAHSLRRRVQRPPLLTECRSGRV